MDEELELVTTQASYAHLPLRALGGMWERVNAGGPVVRLELDGEGVRLQGARQFLRAVIPTYAFRWADVAGVEEVAFATFGGRGVRFVLKHPVRAEHRRLFARLWPRQLRHPVFWPTKVSTADILAHVPKNIEVKAQTRRLWWNW